MLLLMFGLVGVVLMSAAIVGIGEVVFGGECWSGACPDW